MAVDPHQRSASADTASSTGSAFQLILEHVLSYPASYEMPLRTMYTINCAPRAQPLPGSSTPSSNNSSPSCPQGAFSEKTNSQTFTENLLEQMANPSNQPKSLPPVFITSFVQKCFDSNLKKVDFPQALTSLDYLKHLEARRRAEVAAAMSRLDIDRNALYSTMDVFEARYPGVAKWIRSIEEKERKIESLYTQLFVGLRRWILINEMSLLPFNKHNCVAMLNTLYPPVVISQPTSKLTSQILKNQRDGFFNYIRNVEKCGPRVLYNLTQQGKAHGDDNGWLAVTRIVGMYLQLANSIIEECLDITEPRDVSPESERHEPRAVSPELAPVESRIVSPEPKCCEHRVISPEPDRSSTGTKQVRKADSGVSFKSFERPLTASSQGEPPSPTETTRFKVPGGRSSGTTLEKIARGLKTIGRSRTNVTEMVTSPEQPPPSPQPERQKTLRKMRSMPFSTVTASATARSPSDAPPFDADQLRRQQVQRMKYEAGILAAKKFGNHRGHEI